MLNTITFFNFNNYFENPIVKYATKDYKNKQILTEKDLTSEINHLKHSKWAWDNKVMSFIGDELRLFLASQSTEPFTYIDGDCKVLKPELIKLHHCCLEKDGYLNDGSFFKANKDTEWIKHYLNVYEKEDIKDLVNYKVHEKYLFNIPAQSLEKTHFYTSWFLRLSKRLGNCLYYTLFLDKARTEMIKGNDVLWLGSDVGDTYYNLYKAVLYRYYIMPLDLFQAQLDYTCKRHINLINLD